MSVSSEGYDTPKDFDLDLEAAFEEYNPETGMEYEIYDLAEGGALITEIHESVKATGDRLPEWFRAESTQEAWEWVVERLDNDEDETLPLDPTPWNQTRPDDRPGARRRRFAQVDGEYVTNGYVEFSPREGYDQDETHYAKPL